MQTTNVTHYKKNSRTTSPKCVILCQHGDDGTRFLEKFPDFHDVCRLSRRELERYLAVERDFGSPELAYEVAQKLNAAGFNAFVIEVTFPRGIIDPNRVTEMAVQNLFDHGSNILLVQELQAVHRAALNEIQTTLAYVDPSVIIDLHSMAPFTPKADAVSAVRAVKLSPGNVNDYVAAWLAPERQGERRYIDLVTHVKEDGELIKVAALDLAVRIASLFDGGGLRYRFNHPYPTAPEVMTTAYLQSYDGLCIDIPKDFLADGPVDNLAMNPDKTKLVAQCISAGIIEYLAKQAD